MSFIKKAGDNYNPNKIDRLIIASRPGMGKTSSLMQLPNCIYFDLEGSSGYFKGNADVVDIQARMREEDIGMLTAITRTLDEIKASKVHYDFAVLDTLTKIDELAEKVATVKYKKTTQGKDFKGDSILELSFGAGYGLLRNEFEAIVELFDTVAEHKIYVCHVKDSSIPKSGDQVAVTDIKLTGSLKEIFSSKQDAAGLLELDPKDLNRRILNFIKTEDAGFVKCRAQHLDNQKIEISNKIDGELTTSWNKVFLNLNK